MIHYEAIPHKLWVHTSGRTASIYGAYPWVSNAGKQEWHIEQRGWTVRNNRTNTTGFGHPPFKTLDEAEAFIERLEAKG